MPKGNDMRAVVTKSDIEHKKLAKIARLLKKFFHSDDETPDTAILEMIAKSLGYSGLTELNETADRYRGPYLFEWDGYNAIIGVVVGLSLLEVSQKLFVIVRSHLENENDFDRCFSILNFERLDFFGEKRYSVDFSNETTTRLYNYYLYISVNCQNEVDLESDDDDPERSHRDDLISFVKKMDDEDTYDLIYNSISSLFSVEVVQTSAGRPPRNGTYKDLVFIPTHKDLVNRTILQDAWVSGMLPAISAQDLDKMSAILLDMFISDFSLENAIELLFLHKNRQGLYANKFNFNGFNGWNRNKIRYLDKDIIFSTKKMEDESGGSTLNGIFWRADLISPNGDTLVYASGGIYDFDMAGGDDHLQFPDMDESMLTREFQLVERIDYGDVPMPIIFDLEGLSDSQIDDLYKANRWYASDVLITLSSWNKSNYASDSNSMFLLDFCMDKFKKEYGDITIFAYAAPMQYPDWLPENDTPELKFIKEGDIAIIEGLLRHALIDVDKVVIVTPKMSLGDD